MNQPGKEIKDAIWLMGLQGVNYLVPLFVWPYLMFVLGAEQFGVYSFGIALAQYLTLLVDFGFNLTATKQIAVCRDNKEETNRIYTSTMAAKLLLLATSSLIVAVVSLVPTFAPYRAIVWITWLIVVGNTFSMFWLFQGFGRVRLVAIVNAVVKVLILPLTFVFVRSQADVYIAAWIQVAVFLLSGLVTVMMTEKMDLAHIRPIVWTDVREQLKSSWSIFLSNAATSTYTTLFVVLLACFVSTDEVGRYAAAEKLMRCACFMVWIPISQAYFPKISHLCQENTIEAEKLIRKLTLFSIVALGLVGVLLVIGAEPISRFFGKNYTGIGELMLLLAVVPMLVGVGGVQGQMGLIACGTEKDKKAFRNVYLVAGLIALGNVSALSCLWGANGAALSLVLTEGFVCCAMCVLNAKRRKTCRK